MLAHSKIKRLVTMETSKRDTVCKWCVLSKAFLLIYYVFVILWRSFSYPEVLMCLGFLYYMMASPRLSLSVFCSVAVVVAHLACLHQYCCSPVLPGWSEECGRELLLLVCQNDRLSQSCGNRRDSERQWELSSHPKHGRGGQKSPYNLRLNYKYWQLKT